MSIGSRNDLRQLTRSEVPVQDQRDARQHPAATEQPPVSFVRQVFASLFTPSWTLGLLLFACFFMPFVKACGTVYPVKVALAAPEETESLADAWFVFEVCWPFFLGLLVAIGTIGLVAARKPRAAAILWWVFSALILLRCALAVAAFVQKTDCLGFVRTSVSPFVVGVFVGATAPLYRHGHSYYAAMILQLAILLSAAIDVGYLLAGTQLMIGGRIAFACCLMLALATVVQLLDGERVLQRRQGDSPVQLSLRCSLVLMLLGGLAFAWIGYFVVQDLAAVDSTVGPAVQPAVGRDS